MTDKAIEASSSDLFIENTFLSRIDTTG